ncbi:Superfamily II DNA or RNA helicase, SNF2 family [Ferrimonas sediminum]|uniref:Superfamily II DNA or RNA helicase, SNF2 family n=1 Tax=Ferrimonas sediminum TaxID=718193 RepID=A0A1G8UWQ2_9GAMM|nr:SNF2-related protein [Ferrimonas sediminum]SDJ58238.1 Superfamily II DNA or RNA helicase, SNF2 family [Ferrimonas sediminum]
MLKQLVKKLIQKGQQSYRWNAAYDEVAFIVPDTVTRAITQLKAEPWVQHQHVYLSMLVEQGDAERVPNGFVVPAEVLGRLDEEGRELLELPKHWQGQFSAEIKGQLHSPTFQVTLYVAWQTPEQIRKTTNWKWNGTFLTFGGTQKYLLDVPHLSVFQALESHNCSPKSEADNLQLIYALQQAKRTGVNIELAHFDTDKLQIRVPDSVGVQLDVTARGNGILTPSLGTDADADMIQARLGQLRPDATVASLRVGNEIVLLDEDRLKATQEIINHRVISKANLKTFLEKPSAFLDASLVNLDVGFSARVHGATVFKHRYFGDTDESGIDWFGKSAAAQTVQPISSVVRMIEDEDSLVRLTQGIEDARQLGAHEFEFEGKLFDITDGSLVDTALEKAKRKVEHAGFDNESDEAPSQTAEPEEAEHPEVIVVDVDLNDEELEQESPTVKRAIDEVLYPADHLTWDNYARMPFPHQEIGIRWAVGLAENPKHKGGALLADDMGLGKTLMALACIDQLYKIAKQRSETEKPCLIVAPLSLLENWRDEVEKTFNDSPFDDVVLLQSGADLPRFREGGVETKSQPIEGEGGETGIRFSLKVGKRHTIERLDMPRRLVITTYQTLRDYQFSLCSIDWAMVVFDEAQNIKNPNALQTRAAKGLKSDFNLVTTGTPVENSLADFWCLMDTACPGYLSSYQDFRNRYVSPILQCASDEIEQTRERVGRALRETVGALMLRRLKEDNLKGLPEKRVFVGTDDEVWTYKDSLASILAGQQLAVYDATLSTQEQSEQNVVLGCLQRLRDVSLHPRLVDQGRLDVPTSAKAVSALISESSKMASLVNTLDEIRLRDEKCIIFAVNKRLQAFLSVALGRLYALGPLAVINGDAKAVAKLDGTPTRKSMITDFEARDGFNIIIMSPVAAGVGLTVIGANNVIHFERHWNPAKEAQATDRVYRIGQQKDVNIYVPLAHHPEFESFDVNLHKLLTKKTQLKDAVVTPEQVVPIPAGMDLMTEVRTRALQRDDLVKMPWVHFEALCVELLALELGAQRVWLTTNGADHGADGVLDIGDSLVLLQVKHTTKAHYDGHKAIQEVSGAKEYYQNLLGKPVSSLHFATNASALRAGGRKAAKLSKVDVLTAGHLDELLDKHQISYERVMKRLSQVRLNVTP